MGRVHYVEVKIIDPATGLASARQPGVLHPGVLVMLGYWTTRHGRTA